MEPQWPAEGERVARRVTAAVTLAAAALAPWVQALGGRGGHAAHRAMGGLGTAARLGHCCESPRPATTRPLDLGKRN